MLVRTNGQKLIHLKRRVVWFASGAATLLGVFVAALSVLPRISISASNPVDPVDPFSASFPIANNGLIPIRDVRARIRLGRVLTGGYSPIPGFVSNYEGRGGFRRPEWEIHYLRKNEKLTITTAGLFTLGPGPSLGDDDIAIAVSFRPLLLPFQREKVFRFIVRQRTDGNFYWYSGIPNP
jgi:hypothetical protein